MRNQAKIMRESGFVTTREAADAIGVNQIGTIIKMITSGRLVGSRVGVSWYVSVQSLLDMHTAAPVITKRINELGVAPKPVVVSVKAPKPRGGARASR